MSMDNFPTSLFLFANAQIQQEWQAGHQTLISVRNYEFVEGHFIIKKINWVSIIIINFELYY